MTNEQLHLAIGLPTLFNTVLFTLLAAYMHAKFERVETKFDGVNTKFDGVNARFDAIDRRFDDMRDLWRAELHRVEEVLDARLKHLGDLALDPSKSVFINCPFDAEYSSLFDAILFSSVCCGFMLRSALESGTVAEPRLARVTRALFSCRYSIHDLSRCTGEGSENLARFNMPLELGMAMARRFMDAEEHDWLVLVPKSHAYLRACGLRSGNA